MFADLVEFANKKSTLSNYFLQCNTPMVQSRAWPRTHPIGTANALFNFNTAQSISAKGFKK